MAKAEWKSLILKSYLKGNTILEEFIDKEWIPDEYDDLVYFNEDGFRNVFSCAANIREGVYDEDFSLKKYSRIFNIPLKINFEEGLPSDYEGIVTWWKGYLDSLGMKTIKYYGIEDDELIFSVEYLKHKPLLTEDHARHFEFNLFRHIWASPYFYYILFLYRNRHFIRKYEIDIFELLFHIYVNFFKISYKNNYHIKRNSYFDLFDMPSFEAFSSKVHIMNEKEVRIVLKRKFINSSEWRIFEFSKNPKKYIPEKLFKEIIPYEKKDRNRIKFLSKKLFGEFFIDDFNKENEVILKEFKKEFYER